jgi:P-type Mg2+ transporter
MQSACRTYELNGVIRALDREQLAQCEQRYKDASARGFRVLAVAYRAVPECAAYTVTDERDLTLAGFVTFADHVIDGIADSIARLRSDGVQIKILTGDNELVSRHVCEQVGLDATRIVLGSEIEDLHDAALARIAEEVTVFARVSPAQKHRIVRALKVGGHAVGFLGDVPLRGDAVPHWLRPARSTQQKARERTSRAAARLRGTAPSRATHR